MFILFVLISLSKSAKIHSNKRPTPHPAQNQPEKFQSEELLSQLEHLQTLSNELEVIKNCLMATGDIQRCLLLQSPVLSRRARFSKLIPKRNRRNQCQRPCQKAPLTIKSSQLKMAIARAAQTKGLNIDSTDVQFMKGDLELNGESIDMGSCQGNCQQRMEDARSAFLNMHQVSFCTASKTNHLTIKFSGQDVSSTKVSRPTVRWLATGGVLLRRIETYFIFRIGIKKSSRIFS